MYVTANSNTCFLAFITLQPLQDSISKMSAEKAAAFSFPSFGGKDRAAIYKEQ